MAGGHFGDFPAVHTYGGQFIQYSIFGNLFEITSKYRPPIMPIGRGAYGIVWYVAKLIVLFLLLHSFSFRFDYRTFFFVCLFIFLEFKARC